MKNDDVLKEALYSHFLARLRRPSTKKVGIELELPVWNLRGGATDFEAVHRGGLRLALIRERRVHT